MAGIDKMYLTNEERLTLMRWLKKNNAILPSKYRRGKWKKYFYPPHNDNEEHAATNFPPDIDRFLFRKARWSDDVNKFLTRELEVQYPTWFEPHGQAIESMPLIGE